ncbi:MAG: radical SAM protein [Chthonomonadales bacterium]|nr:radical SAM protein [Chthonomonadales bacterium]
MSLSRPQLHPAAVARREGSRVLLLNPVTGAWCVLDDAGYRLAARLDGSVSVAALARETARATGARLARVRSDVAACVESLARAGLVFEAGQAPGEPGPPAPERRPLLQATIQITFRCNLTCAHCGQVQVGEVRPRDSAVPVERLRARIDSAVGAGAATLYLTGGEPLTHPRWPEVVRYAANRADTGVMTNAIPVTEAAADILAASGACVQVSLDGPDARSHDALRGAGAFVRTMRGVDRLLARGLGERMTWSVCVNRHNVGEVERLLLLALERGVGSVNLLRVRREGMAATHWEAIGLRDEEFAAMARRVRPLLEQHPGRFRLAGCGAAAGLPIRKATEYPCPIAHGQSALIDSTGAIYPCDMLTGPEHRLGNADEGVVDALASTNADRLRDMVVERPGKVEGCRSCAWRRACAGACPGLALARAGTVHATDGMCGIRDETYTRTAFAFARLRASAERATAGDR